MEKDKTTSTEQFEILKHSCKYMVVKLNEHSYTVIRESDKKGLVAGSGEWAQQWAKRLTDSEKINSTMDYEFKTSDELIDYSHLFTSKNNAMPKSEQPTTEQLKELLSKITQGEWYKGVRGYTVYSSDNSTDFKVLISGDGEEKEKNADLISLAPTLAKEVIELREENKVLREALAWISKVTNSPEIGIRCDKILKQTEQP